MPARPQRLLCHFVFFWHSGTGTGIGTSSGRRKISAAVVYFEGKNLFICLTIKWEGYTDRLGEKTAAGRIVYVHCGHLERGLGPLLHACLVRVIVAVIGLN